MMAAVPTRAFVWLKDSVTVGRVGSSYVKVYITAAVADVADLIAAVLSKFQPRWGQRADDDILLYFVSATEEADTEPSVAKETTALATDPLKPTQSLAKAGITPGCFLLAKCTGAAAAGTTSGLAEITGASAAAGEMQQAAESLKRSAQQLEEAAKRARREKATFSDATVGDAVSLQRVLGVDVELQAPPPSQPIAGLPHQWMEGYTEPREAPALREKLVSALQELGVVIQIQEATAQQDPVVLGGFKIVSAAAFPYSFQLGDTLYSGHGDAAIVSGTCPAGPSTAPRGVRVLVEWKSTDKMKLDEEKWGKTSAQSMLELAGGTLASSHDILVLTSDLITAHVFRLVGNTMQVWKGLPATAGVQLVASFLRLEASVTGGLPPNASEQRKAAMQLVKDKLSNDDAMQEMLEQITAFDHLPGLQGLFAMRQMAAGIADSWYPTPLTESPPTMYS